ncbi:hypothetical protein NHP190003_07680 [Helicobacter sp. NHP19-003]|uniref:TIR domain-containing protein n=1 Tax=Helicobacter gastrocanis TaxID=2849641 RepID=A0ABN6I1M3_9HELI|nr:hypothetical protein [Helicobacter sp. NHP19-003]BCZ17486.1 hypothetical protein NHP190003_07680 [Helicobacter sp. NHP19-003]
MDQAYRIGGTCLYEDLPYLICEEFDAICEEFDQEREDLVAQIIKKVRGKNGISGDGLQKLLFPKVRGSQIFLSHAFKDKDKALYIRECIETEQPQCRVFIDSLYWQSVYEAQEELKKLGASNAAKNLYPMLCVALAQMIQTCRYFIFIETKHSLGVVQDLQDDLNNLHTQSSWIYYELQIARLFLKQKQPQIQASLERLNESAEIPFYYNVTSILKAMKLISLDSLVRQLK